MKRITLQAWATKALDIDPAPSIQITDLEALRKLPSEGWEGIYFLWLNDELQYIGQSTEIPTRVRRHENSFIIDFDRHTCIEIEKSMFNHYERAYIDHYKPPHNRPDGPWRRRRT